MKPHQQIDAGLDHGGGVQKGADGRRGAHGIGQPEMEGKLGRFGQRAEQHRAADRRIEGMPSDGVARVQPLADRVGAAGRLEQDGADEQGQAPGPGHEQGLAGIVPGRGGGVVESDQQVGKNGGQLPKDEQEQQIVRHDDAQHGDHEGVQEKVKAADVRMAGHVGGSIEGDEKTGTGDDQPEQQAQPVEPKPQVEVQGGHPRPLHLIHMTLDHGRPRHAQAGKQEQRQERRHQCDGAASRPVRRAIRERHGHPTGTGKGAGRPT